MEEEPAEKLNRDRRINPNLMWVLAAAFLFLIGAGFYASMTRDHEGNPQPQASDPSRGTAGLPTTDSSVAGARGPSGQAEPLRPGESTRQTTGSGNTGQR
jgi:hypothetical protein